MKKLWEELKLKKKSKKYLIIWIEIIQGYLLFFKKFIKNN